MISILRKTTPLTERAARAYAGGFDAGGTKLAFMSYERNGEDADVYVVDVQRPTTKKLVYAGGGDYSAAGWLDDTHVLVEHLISHKGRVLFSLDINTGFLAPLLPSRDTGFRVLDATHDRTHDLMYLAADLDGDFASLHVLDSSKRTTEPLLPGLKWDVVAIQALADGQSLALLVNEDAHNRLYLFDLSTRTLRKVQNVSSGFLNRIAAHPTLPLIAIDILGPDGLSGVWTYDAQADRFEAWAVPPADEAQAAPEVIHYPTFDQVDVRPRLIPAIVVDTEAHPPGGSQLSLNCTVEPSCRACPRTAVGRHCIGRRDYDHTERARVRRLRHDLCVAGFGDWHSPEMLHFLESISPARQANKIGVPLMIYQGANDVRVKPHQSRSMAEHIRSAGGYVTLYRSAERRTQSRPAAHAVLCRRGLDGVYVKVS